LTADTIKDECFTDPLNRISCGHLLTIVGGRPVEVPYTIQDENLVWNFWWFGELQKSTKLNTAKFSFIVQCM